MSGFIWFVAGAAISFVVCSVFYGNKAWELWERNTKLVALIEEQTHEMEHLRQKVEPRQWDETWPGIVPNPAPKLYDKYAELVEPGTEVIDLTDAEEMD